MKANKAPKSKFVYPDKLYAKTKDNITLDISYAPQTVEAVEYIREDAFIEKACAWLEENADMFEAFDSETDTYYMDKNAMIEDFKKAMGMKQNNKKKKEDDFSLMGTPLSGDRDLDMAIFFGIENG
jgi:hypothetical protein